VTASRTQAVESHEHARNGVGAKAAHQDRPAGSMNQVVSVHERETGQDEQEEHRRQQQDGPSDRLAPRRFASFMLRGAAVEIPPVGVWREMARSSGPQSVPSPPGSVIGWAGGLVRLRLGFELNACARRCVEVGRDGQTKSMFGKRSGIADAPEFGKKRIDARLVRLTAFLEHCSFAIELEVCQPVGDRGVEFLQRPPTHAVGLSP
jgi:hypothetical protein